MAQFLCCSAVKLENPLATFLGRCLISGITNNSIICWIFWKSLTDIKSNAFHTSNMCLVVPSRRLCIGSMMHILALLKYGRSFSTVYQMPYSLSISFCSFLVLASQCFCPISLQYCLDLDIQSDSFKLEKLGVLPKEVVGIKLDTWNNHIMCCKPQTHNTFLQPKCHNHNIKVQYKQAH